MHELTRSIDNDVITSYSIHYTKLYDLVHISEIADKFIKHPLDVLSVGDIVNVVVLSIDFDKKRVSLSIKRAQ